MPHQSIEQYLTSQEWISRFDEHLLPHGKKLSSPRHITALALEPLEDGGYELRAHIESHTLEISLWQENEHQWHFDTTCTCEHGFHCPHAAAALMRASRPNTLSRLIKGGTLDTAPAQKSTPASAPPSPESPPPSVTPHSPVAPVFHLSIAEEPATGRATQLLLQALKTPERTTWLVARPSVHYGSHIFPLHKSGIDDNQHTIPRDRPAEFRALEALKKLALTNLSSNPSYRFLLSLAKKNKQDDSAAGAWFPEPHLTTPAVYWPWFRARAIPKLLKEGWQIHIDENFGHHVRTLEPDDLDASLTPAPGGWFTLSVGIDLEGQKLDLLPILTGLLDSDTLDQLNELSHDDLHLIYLPNGGAIQLPAGRLRKILHHLAALTDPTQAHMHPLDAAALVVDAELPIPPIPELEKLRKKLAQPQSTPQKYSPPKGLQAELRDYQKTGVEWMRFLTDTHLHGILADDMGLGKTLQTLTLILQLKAQAAPTQKNSPTLVIAPTSVVPNWAAEAKKFTPSLNTLTLQGSKRRQLFTHIPHADIVITSYALLQRDIETLKKHSFQIAVLDEAQHIKNPSAKVTQAACQLHATQRLCLSGTPVENNLGELWSLFHFLIPGFLGSREKFRTTYQNPIEKEGDEARAELLRNRLAPLILRRTKDEVAKELPPKTILVHPVELSSHQKDLYETVRATMDKQVRQAIAARGLEQSQFAILDALLKLRQICCHPSLLKLPNNERGTGVPPVNQNTSAKLDYLFDLLDTLFAEGRRVLLFSQFTSMLSLIEEELLKRKIKYLKLTGSSKDRGQLVKDFQEKNIPIFLISLKAGGTGLTLTAADTVIHYDPWWNPAAENQATDRAYRIGQDKPVFVHKLLCANTVEDRIHQLQQKKSHLADSLLSAASKSTPDAETLRNLLSPIE